MTPFISPISLKRLGSKSSCSSYCRDDIAAAESFINNSSARTKLKHTDCRQEWVCMLRNKEVILPIHVSSADNLADLTHDGAMTSPITRG